MCAIAFAGYDRRRSQSCATSWRGSCGAKGVVRSAQERLELSLDVAALLTRVAEQITGEVHGGSLTPERTCVLNGTLVSEAYLDWIRGEGRCTRYRALDRAAELVHGPKWKDWISSYEMTSEARDIRKVIRRLRELDATVATRLAAHEEKLHFMRSQHL